jgi:hypothetical protein
VKREGLPAWRPWSDDTQLTPCMPCSFGLLFGLLPHPRSEPRAQPIEVLEVTVVVRCILLVSAAVARGWHGRRDRRCSHLAATAPTGPKCEGPSSVSHSSWARAPRARSGGTGTYRGSPVPVTCRADWACRRLSDQQLRAVDQMLRGRATRTGATRQTPILRLL